MGVEGDKHAGRRVTDGQAGTQADEGRTPRCRRRARKARSSQEHTQAQCERWVMRRAGELVGCDISQSVEEERVRRGQKGMLDGKGRGDGRGRGWTGN